MNKLEVLPFYLSTLVICLNACSNPIRDLSQITFALGVGRWSEKCVVCYIKSANQGRTWSKNANVICETPLTDPITKMRVAHAIELLIQTDVNFLVHFACCFVQILIWFDLRIFRIWKLVKPCDEPYSTVISPSSESFSWKA